MLKDVQARLESDEGSDEFYGSVFIMVVPSETEDERMTARSGKAPTLYLAYRGEYDEEGILGVFPTMESAMQALRDHGDPGKDGEPPTTEELTKRIVPVRLGEVIR